MMWAIEPGELIIAHVLTEGSPILHWPISSLPRTIINRTRDWCFLSTHPPCLISDKRALVANRAISSGVSPGEDAASEQCMADVVDSASKLSAYPGDLHAGLVEWKYVQLAHILSTFISFVNIGVQVNVGNEPVENRTRCVDHTIRELRINTDGMSGRILQCGMPFMKR